MAVTVPSTYTVKRGDCLWNIAKTYYGDPYKYKEIAELNNLKNANSISVGQVLKMPGGSSSSTTTKKNTSNCPTDVAIFELAGTDSLFATWKWDWSNTKEYQVRWEYYTLNKRWFRASENDSTTTLKESTYNPPTNAVKIRVKVKPIAETEKKNDTEVAKWTANWSKEANYDRSDVVLTTPSTPTVEVKDYSLNMRLENLNDDATHIIFEIVQDDNKVIHKTANTAVKIVTSVASYTYTVASGHEYKVRCRAYDSSNKVYSDWSQYSSNVGTKPDASTGITTIRAESETSVYLEWASVKNAETYDIEYATNRNYFDGSDQTTSTSGIEFNHYLKSGLTTGQQYFFRVRAVNSKGESAWSDIQSVVLGTTPAAPTTWSSTTTGVTGESLTLYWVHNCEDKSTQTYAEIEMYVDGVKQLLPTIDTTEQEDDEKTMHYPIDTSAYPEGTKIQWRVRTAGVTKNFGDWSIQRTVDIYAPPTLVLEVPETLTAFPLYISGTAAPNTQEPIGYHVSIIANSAYETVDNLGNPKTVIEGEEVYSKYYDTKEQLLLQISAGSVDLENNIDYTVSCTVSMNSGLTATANEGFTVAWTEESYTPTAEIGFNEDDISVYIRPYCVDENEELIDGVSLSVYRREFDGTFTELATGIDNLSGTYITDPHPSLDLARYRIVAIENATGAVSYYDPPGYPVNVKSIVIQWNEEWSNFEVDSEDALSEPPWSGSMLILPYNVDVSESKSLDISLINYIGRRHPVSYYGTHVGEKADWSVVIPKEDKETLYSLRRLSIWMGDVYVREPSGCGYWASIAVSFNQTHADLTIPVSISVTRVEGGV